MKPERLPLSLGVAGLLALSIVSPAGAQGKPDSADRFPPKSDWSRVQTLKPGVRTTVKLYDEEAPKGTVYKAPPKDGAAADGQQ